MRGEGCTIFQQPQIVRITPAYAGRSKITADFPVYLRDHPRLCGEKAKLLPVLLRLPGSPPPMRGEDNRDKSGYGAL